MIGRHLYAETDPDHFGTLEKTFFRLFALITLDNWYIASVNILESLFTAILVNNLQQNKTVANSQKKKAKLRRSTKQGKRQEENSTNYLEIDESLEIDGKTSTKPSFEGLVDEKMIDSYYGINNKEVKDLFKTYYQLIASLELNQNSYGNQTRVLEDLVNLSKKKEIEDEKNLQ
ncbi:hypothetical protein O9G_003499 [Rozella allomycis CSF55]|uniref:Uncharacterized protein n=1 Tax=Rozella allomycis (strain CSF55) TaxID=988480 RepID=A0A075AY06_ROZAC|nr:hypothetical protein O9G_003499 [Rozella allomycis CSF55]|eukprot:EPZ35127.1 hypothetical protein O9G_003499 [Rozella allomycis CSF55]